MSLAAITARRLMLRRGAAALAGLFVTSATSSARGPDVLARGYGYGNSASALASPQNDREHQIRQALAKPLSEQQNEINRVTWMRWRAWNETDNDLKCLGSVSPAWRASVMHDRLKARQSVLDDIESKLRAIWEEPLAKVQQLAAAWFKKVLQ